MQPPWNKWDILLSASQYGKISSDTANRTPTVHEQYIVLHMSLCIHAFYFILFYLQLGSIHHLMHSPTVW